MSRYLLWAIATLLCCGNDSPAVSDEDYYVWKDGDHAIFDKVITKGEETHQVVMHRRIVGSALQNGREYFEIDIWEEFPSAPASETHSKRLYRKDASSPTSRAPRILNVC